MPFIRIKKIKQPVDTDYTTNSALESENKKSCQEPATKGDAKHS